jgi:Flp pilus assembly protein TadG
LTLIVMAELRPSLRAFRDDRQGSVAIISAFLLPVLIGTAALVAEFGFGLLMRVENQRIADLAAFAGGTAYASTNDTAKMNAVIANLAALNGMPSGSVTGSLGMSPSGTGNQAVSVTVSRSRLLLLAPVVSGTSSMSVGGSAAAEVAGQAPGCVLALNPSGGGVTLSGGTALTASDCAVSSNAAVSVPCGTSIVTKAVNYNSAGAPSQPCQGIQPPAGTASVRMTRATTTDPLASDPAVLAATSRLAIVGAYANPTIAAVPAGTDISFGWDQSATQAQAGAVGCSATFLSSTWTLTCPNGGNYRFRNVTLGGGITVKFNLNGTANTTYNFSGSIDVSGTAISFGPGTYNIAQGITTGGGSTTSFAGGAFNIGGGNCNGVTYSICHVGAELSFGGPSTFVLTNGISVGGGSNLTLGAGTTNSYVIGPSSNGNGLMLGGGSKTKLHDATGSSSLFRVIGNVNVASGGGSCLAIPAAAQHDIKGYLSTAGGTILGSGNYTVTGYVALGANGGGDVTCWGTNVGISGTDVTFAIGANTTISSGACAGTAFCVGSGYGNVTLKAPTSGATAKLLAVGPTGANATAGALFTQGASNQHLVGAFYFPKGPISLSGGASASSGSGACLQVVGSQVTLSGGTALATACLGTTSGASKTVLVR